jgi:hypothetical protein
MSRVWKCYNKSCGVPLGTLVQGELVLQNGNPNVASVCTEGMFLNVQCSACGRVARWVPKDSAIVSGFFGTHLMKETMRQIVNAWTKFRAVDDIAKDQEGAEDDS